MLSLNSKTSVDKERKQW